MDKKKIIILLPDGVGVRNFVYSDFCRIAESKNFSITFWNDTPLDLSSLGYDEKKMHHAKSHPLTQLLKSAKMRIELNINIAKTHDDIYESYYFLPPTNGIKNKIKSVAIHAIAKFYSSESGLAKVRKMIMKLERKTNHYQKSFDFLKAFKPDFIFCTNQRHVTMIAPILAAEDLGIPNATFIFSWDNLPKATLSLETNFYFVWSTHMKQELLKYYPFVRENQVYITGTPQFSFHYDQSVLISKEAFFAKYQLNPDKKYICFSGDDETTSPDDAQYLDDVAAAVSQLNEEGLNLGIVFRRSPVDFSTRYDLILKKYDHLIVSIKPDWKTFGEKWNAIMPTENDMKLLVNTIEHTEMVINLGSSMVFDYAAKGKPCAFINYDSEHKARENWSVDIIYKFIHFRSMPSSKSVIWLNGKHEIGLGIKKALTIPHDTVAAANQWFEKINESPANESSARILSSIESILALKN